MKIFYGTTRTVLHTGNYVIKIPALSSWKHFLCGLLANQSETLFSKFFSSGLCPVVFGVWGGWLIIMPYAKPLTLEEFTELDVTWWSNRGDYIIPVEDKQDSFGWLNNEIVAVDYGSCR